MNRAYDPSRVPAVSGAALPFHRSLAGYAPTPVRSLGAGAWLKDESARLGLPAFKVLGVSWAVERALRADPGVTTLVAASAGNHGRAVAHVAARRGLVSRVYLPERSAVGRRRAIESEGAEVVVIDGTYEQAVAAARAAAAEPGVLELADVGDSPAAHAVIDGYATLFAEVDASFDTVVVPVGVGSLAAAAARWGAATATRVIGAEPDVAACLTAALAAGRPVAVETPGTSMAGLDCALVSAAAWDSLLPGIAGTVTVSDAQAHAAMRVLAARGLTIGDCGAATFAALELLRAEGAALGERVLLIGTEGATDPDGYAATLAAARTAS